MKLPITEMLVAAHGCLTAYEMFTFEITEGGLDVQVYVVQTDTCLSIYVRGSEPKLADWRTNFKIRKKVLSGGRKVHRGYWTAALVIYERLMPWLRAVAANKLGVTIGGHSAGGSIAIALADRMGRQYALRGVYAFAVLPTGNKAWAEAYPHHDITWRLEFGHDAVPRLLALTYEDVGTLVQLDEKGEVRINPTTWQQAWATLSRPSHWVRDHGMKNYVSAVEQLAAKEGVL